MNTSSLWHKLEANAHILTEKHLWQVYAKPDLLIITQSDRICVDSTLLMQMAIRLCVVWCLEQEDCLSPQVWTLSEPDC